MPLVFRKENEGLFFALASNEIGAESNVVTKARKKESSRATFRLTTARRIVEGLWPIHVPFFFLFLLYVFRAFVT